jgi:hypothetical protein
MHLTEEYGIDGTNKLPKSKYGELCEWIATPQEELDVHA